MNLFKLLTSALLFLGAVSAANADTKITYKSEVTSSYYQMAVEIAEAMKKVGGEIIVTVEESQVPFRM